MWYILIKYYVQKVISSLPNKKGLSFYWGVRFYGGKHRRKKCTTICKRNKLEALANEVRKVGTKIYWRKQGLIFKAKYQTIKYVL